ncbi:MAG: hypothetical protein LIO94_06270 [Clostridiales bacterium]|nr:hypothetical protein [Clostridiales bacterium]
MSRVLRWEEEGAARKKVISFLLLVCAGIAWVSVPAAWNLPGVIRAEAEEVVIDESGVSEDTVTDSAALEDILSDADASEDSLPEENGSYTMEDGWYEDSMLSTGEVTVYRQDACADAAETSTISCSYLDTNYSRTEYEQLRDMLTNNLVYGNVNAQITTSAVYTLSMDYLYIILVDDSSNDYRDIYYYVVGDYQCFCVQVKEYRSEAEQASAQDLQTPQEAGQKVAESFVW